ncbi:MAG: hypothetical protein Q4C14_05260 [Bacillota bacterium]|nr:hypothetical protein [Bacillota bacterium]
MKSRICCLGIDTSNYTTSAAVVDENLNIIGNSREILRVKQGERGLRQSQALFEHIGNLPRIIEQLEIQKKGCRICAVAVSERPRRVEGSYMPVFKAGETVGKSLAGVTGAAYYGFSHQEGHIEAARYSSGYKGDGEFLSLHLSGGTTEVLICRELPGGEGYRTEIAGGTKDISLGQLIDRTGVRLGFRFPCGKLMDEAALRKKASADRAEMKALESMFCRIKTENGMCCISGIETRIQRYIDDIGNEQEGTDEMISAALFFRIGQAVSDIISQSRKGTGILPVIAAGGVASSRFIREMLSEDEKLYFGSPELSSDNAVGTAILGMKRYLANETGTSFTVK